MSLKRLRATTVAVLLPVMCVLCLVQPRQLDAQVPPSQEELIKRRDKKLQKDFLNNGAWMTDYDAARQAAVDQKKLIFTYFTRSYSP